MDIVISLRETVKEFKRPQIARGKPGIVKVGRDITATVRFHHMKLSSV